MTDDTSLNPFSEGLFRSMPPSERGAHDAPKVWHGKFMYDPSFDHDINARYAAATGLDLTTPEGPLDDEPLCIMGIRPDSHRPWEIARTITLTTHMFTDELYVIPMFAHLVEYEDGERAYIGMFEFAKAFSQRKYELGELRSLELQRDMTKRELEEGQK